MSAVKNVRYIGIFREGSGFYMETEESASQSAILPSLRKESVFPAGSLQEAVVRLVI